MRGSSVPSHRLARRLTASVTAAVVTAGLLVVVAPASPAAAAGGPSVGQPDTPSVPVTAQGMDPRPADPATRQALSGDQPAGGTPGAGAGAPTATSLSPSATWTVSPQTGDFAWSYPLRTPPVPGGLAPELAFSYRSSTVDGRTSTTNNQPSWVGDGWDLNPGFVERTYGPCAADKEGGTTPPADKGDLCWRSDNATASYGAGGGMLIRDDTSGGWRAKQDDGSRIERLTGAGNGDNNGEHWKITTVDGIQYFFGSRAAALSTWTVPVFGDDAGEPCHGATLAGSRCTQAWRWNLDKVVDPNGNQILFHYQTETNKYGVDTARSYVRGGNLWRVDYGLHTSAASQPAARVLFGVADRCVPGSTCTLSRTENWPDTALAERCTGGTCPESPSPTFWSTKRLATVTTQVRGSDGEFDNVDRWSLDHQFPAPGDGEKAALWLKSITHTGLVDGEAQLPPVTFEGAAMPNRVHQADGLSPLLRYRITGVVSESGGLISVVYAPPDCVPGQSMPDLDHADANTHRCFPVTWARPGHAERTDWFHKYVVESVSLSDRISSNLAELVTYQYLGGAAWHYDTSEFTPKDKRTWNEFRGFGRVRVHNGRTPDPGGPVTMSEQRFFRGMDRDKTSGGHRSVTVADTEGGTFPDHDWLQGTGRESITYLGQSTTVVDKSITDPVWRGPTATRGEFKAYQVRPGTVRTFTPLAGGGRRVTKQVTSYDDRGLPTVVNDLGDVSLASDDLCTRTTYVRDTAGWLLSAPSRKQTISVHCGVDPAFPDDAVSDRRFSYDGQAWGAAPRAGNPTRVETLKEHPTSGPVYQVDESTGYDPHGRPTAVTDALDQTTRTAYTPATGGPTTRTVVTDPLGFTTTVDLHPALGEPVTVTDVNDNSTDTAYDPLGRVSEVWQSDRARKWGFSSSYRFSYQIRREAPTVVTTTAIGPNGTYTSTNELYDGLLRRRQVQQPAVGGGRLLTDVRYDSQGRVYKSTNPYFNDAPVDTTLWVASDVEIPGHTLTEFDGAGRPTASIQMAGAVPLWRSTSSYGGDRVHVTPPPGGTAATTVQDARGKTVALHQYHSGSPTGPSDLTRYGYTPAGQLASVTDPAGNIWRYDYDLRGRLVHTDDPDKGEATSRYDVAGQLTSRTDARGETLDYAYDQLGRTRTIHTGGTDGRLLAEWTYDTVARAKGHPATATRYDPDGNAYTSEVLTYTARYQPRKTAITIPASEKALAGSYETSVSYNPDGSVLGESFPAIGDLFEEEVFHTYDDVGRPLTTYGGPEGSTVTYASQTDYTRYGEQQRLQLGTGTNRAWLSQYYDGPTRRLDRTIVDAELPRPMQSDRHYRYDPAGNVTSIADTPQDQPADNQCFRYDYLRRLTDAWTPAGDCATDPDAAELAGPAPYRQSFTFDKVGNRLGQVEHTAGGDDVTRRYTYPDPGADLPHALSSVTTTGPAGARSSGYQYDAAGNTTARDGQQLRWDEQGLLASVTEDGAATEYVHDAVGQRLIRRGPETTTLYLGDQEVQLDHATGELTGTRYYGHGGRTIAARTSAGLTWLFSDHHGTAEVAIDAGTLTATTRRHDPFGRLRGTEPASWPGERGFVGGQTDADTGLTQLGAREYDPVHGRFISVDPILDPADPQQLNAYAYANNSPVTMADPDGLKYFVDLEGYVTAPPAAGWTPKAQQRVRDQMKKWAPRYKAWAGQKKQRDDAVRKATGYSPEDYARAQKVKQKSTFDVVIEAGGAILSEFLGIEDIKGCFGSGNIGSCISMVINIIPWSKLFKLGSLIGAVKKAWKAVSNFRSMQKWADRVTGAVDNARKRIKQTFSSCHSFRADTRVRMADGSTKPISQIALGDKVLATDPETGRTEAHEVVTLHTNLDRDFADLTVAGADGDRSAGTVHTTENHPIWSDQEQAWVEAGELAPGDRLLTSTGQQVEVDSVNRYTGEQLMHDLTIDQVHSYYVVVGGSDVLVHNNSSYCVHSYPGMKRDRPCPQCGAQGGRGNPDANVQPGSASEASRTHLTGEADSAVPLMHDALQTGNVGDAMTATIMGAAAVASGVKAAGQRLANWRARRAGR